MSVLISFYQQMCYWYGEIWLRESSKDGREGGERFGRWERIAKEVLYYSRRGYIYVYMDPEVYEGMG